MRVLDRVTGPSDLRSLTDGELDRLRAEIRDQLVETVSRTGGHLGPNLGVVELTLALHRTFDSPSDRIVFDTGHQAYVHKMVTGRAGAFDGLRSADGLSGYPSRAESVHDVVENSHASTALSYADGLAKAYALRGERRHVVAVIGDGALTGGMAWEALNNLAAGGGRGRRLVVVLNDNGRSYTPTVGGLADHLGGLRRQPGSGLFGDLGLRYTGPVDGHDRAALEAALGAARDAGDAVVVHVVTSKGHGYAPAESHAADRFHSPGPFDALTGAERPKGPTWTEVFSEEMVALGSERPDVVALTAAMLHPVGLHAFAERHPERTFDVGIAEQHAATCAAGLAMGGLHPVVAVYATFLNRAFDQVLMDVALHRCGVTFVLDRAGVTGDDGASHNGMWDMSVLQVVPGLRIAAPRDATRLRALLREAVQVEDAPTVVRFAKGAPPVDLDAVATAGGCDVLVRAGGQDVLLVAVGAMAETCVEVAERLVAQGVGVTVVDPRWVKPVDPALVGLAGEHRLVVSVEDNGVVGGCGSVLLQTLTSARVRTPVRLHGIPQEFLPHAKRAAILERVGLGARALARSIVEDMAALEAGALLPVR